MPCSADCRILPLRTRPGVFLRSRNHGCPGFAPLRIPAGRTCLQPSSRSGFNRRCNLTEQPLQELGLDSLLSIELRNALGLAMDRILPATLLFNYPTLDALTTFLMRELGEETAPGSTVRIAPKSDRKSLLEDIEALSDEEVDRLLDESAMRGAV